MRLLLEFAASPQQACGPVDEILDGHIALVKGRIVALTVLEKQLVGLRKTCDGDTSHPCAMLATFVSAAGEHASTSHAEANKPR